VHGQVAAATCGFPW